MSARALLARVATRGGAGRRSVRPVSWSAGFTLIEIMIVVAIVAVIMASGVPSLFRAIQKDALRRGVSDIMEACSHARAQAILQGVPSEFRIRAEDGLLEVPVSRRPPQQATDEAGFPIGPPDEPPASKGSVFSRRLDDDVAVEFLDVNFRDHMEEPEARVHFFPNGTSDEFTIVVSTTQGSFKISLDMVTGLASSEKLR